mmetsp:Transcript_2207/g.2494  ORF Transcript_2207/g.2494 Transcript_2207/m.2494 type:complete len:114 (+) Transcript_2207:240-581(+)
MMKATMEIGNEKVVVDMKSLAKTQQSIAFVRNVMSIVMGSAAGILGYRGSEGFILYVILFLLTSVGIAAKMNFKVGQYIPNQTLLSFLTSGIGGQALAFVLYWTLFYALVHLY